MASQRAAASGNFARIITFTGLLIWVSCQLGPSVIEGELRPWAALAGFLAALEYLRLVICVLQILVMSLTGRARTVSGRSGTADWAKRKELKKERTRKKQGPLWGG